MIRMKPDIILWDFDGTLADSTRKNIETTKEILSVVAPHLTNENLPECLKDNIKYSEANHDSINWQDLHKNYYGLNKNESNKAGMLWSEYQIKNTTPINLFPGIKEVLKKLSGIPHGICSQNSSKIIEVVLKNNNILNNFNIIIGYDDIGDDEQKPSPKSGIICLEKIFKSLSYKTILYIGDHECDVQFARNLTNELDESNKVYSVTVTYSGANPDSWKYQPDLFISAPLELLNFIC